MPTEYVMLIFPANPVGENVFPETPVPDHVPPNVAEADRREFKFSVPDDWQSAAGAVHVASAAVITLILWLSVAVQGAVPAVYVILMFPLSPDGLKIVPVTPVPDQVPPVVVVADIKVVKSNVPADWQSDVGAVHVAIAEVATLML